MTLRKSELKRLSILERVASGATSYQEGSQSLGITERQLRRLRQRYQAHGAKGLVHGNRGRHPSHALREEIKSQVVKLYEEKYPDSNYTHYGELLAEYEGIELSTSSVRRILKNSGHKNKRSWKRRPKKHQRRARRSQAGMLWQIDATPYDWLGKEFGRFALHAMIDDATGIVTGACFTKNECSAGYVTAMKEGIRAYGIPMGLYSDQHTIFRSPNEKLSVEQELDGERIPLSNFGKALAELHIEHIKAHTPQAKGRIERLWETLQDRLPVELRLMGVKTIEAANAALPKLIARHNAKYSVPPAKSESAYAPLGGNIDLEYVFAERTTRKVGGGNSISYKSDIYVPVAADRWVFDAKVTVEVRETTTGEVVIWHEGGAILLKRIDRSPGAVVKQKANNTGEKTHYKPPENHPWRRDSIVNKVRDEQSTENYAAQ